MLVLSRRLGEKLIIGDNIEINILGITGNQVRMGIDAPKSINVVREEIAGQRMASMESPELVQTTTDHISQRAQPNISYLRRRSKIRP